MAFMVYLKKNWAAILLFFHLGGSPKGVQHAGQRKFSSPKNAYFRPCIL